MPSTAIKVETPSFASVSGAVYNWRWYAFGVVVFAGVLDLLDALITTIAAPAILASIGGGESIMQWVTAGYTLALSSGLIVGGRLGDIFGHRRVFLTGMIGFTVASFLCGVAQDPGSLVALRVLQGLFGAVMLPQGLAFFKLMFPPREIGKAFGFIGPIMGIAGVCGPIVGGGLISANLLGLGWRTIFLINLPLGLIGIVAALRFLPKGGERKPVKLDWVGAIIVSAAALLIIFPVVQGHAAGWPLWTAWLLLGGVALFVVFGQWESRLIRRGADPLVIPTLFRKRGFVGGLAGALSLFSSVMGFSLVFTIFVQLGLHYTPFMAALAVLPLAAGQMLGTVLAHRGLADRLGRGLIHLGIALSIIGIGVLAVTVEVAGPGVQPWHFLLAHTITGVGFGFALSELFTIVLAAVDPPEAGSASGTFTAVQQFAGALGVAVLGTVFFGFLLGTRGGPIGFQIAFSKTLGAVWICLALAFAAVFTLPKEKPSFGPPPPPPQH